MNKLVFKRFFTCGLTGDECAIAFDRELGEEICISYQEGLDLITDVAIRYSEQQYEMERGC